MIKKLPLLLLLVLGLGLALGRCATEKKAPVVYSSRLPSAEVSSVVFKRQLSVPGPVNVQIPLQEVQIPCSQADQGGNEDVCTLVFDLAESRSFGWRQDDVNIDNKLFPQSVCMFKDSGFDEADRPFLPISLMTRDHIDTRVALSRGFYAPRNICYNAENYPIEEVHLFYRVTENSVGDATAAGFRYTSVEGVVGSSALCGDNERGQVEVKCNEEAGKWCACENEADPEQCVFNKLFGIGRGDGFSNEGFEQAGDDEATYPINSACAKRQNPSDTTQLEPAFNTLHAKNNSCWDNDLTDNKPGGACPPHIRYQQPKRSSFTQAEVEEFFTMHTELRGKMGQVIIDVFSENHQVLEATYEHLPREISNKAQPRLHVHARAVGMAHIALRATLPGVDQDVYEVRVPMGVVPYKQAHVRIDPGANAARGNEPNVGTEYTWEALVEGPSKTVQGLLTHYNVLAHEPVPGEHTKNFEEERESSVFFQELLTFCPSADGTECPAPAEKEGGDDDDEEEGESKSKEDENAHCVLPYCPGFTPLYGFWEDARHRNHPNNHRYRYRRCVGPAGTPCDSTNFERRVYSGVIERSTQGYVGFWFPTRLRLGFAMLGQGSSICAKGVHCVRGEDQLIQNGCGEGADVCASFADFNLVQSIKHGAAPELGVAETLVYGRHPSSEDAVSFVQAASFKRQGGIASYDRVSFLLRPDFEPSYQFPDSLTPAQKTARKKEWQKQGLAAEFYVGFEPQSISVSGGNPMTMRDQRTGPKANGWSPERNQSYFRVQVFESFKKLFRSMHLEDEDALVTVGGIKVATNESLKNKEGAYLVSGKVDGRNNTRAGWRRDYLIPPSSIKLERLNSKTLFPAHKSAAKVVWCLPEAYDPQSEHAPSYETNSDSENKNSLATLKLWYSFYGHLPMGVLFKQPKPAARGSLLESAEHWPVANTGIKPRGTNTANLDQEIWCSEHCSANTLGGTLQKPCVVFSRKMCRGSNTSDKYCTLDGVGDLLREKKFTLVAVDRYANEASLEGLFLSMEEEGD